MIDKSYYCILHYVTTSAINSIWTQAASVTVRIVAQRDVLSASQDRSDVTSFMSVAFEGCNFEATSLHFLLWLLALRR